MKKQPQALYMLRKKRGVIELEAMMIAIVCAGASLVLYNLVIGAKGSWESAVESELGP